MSKKPILCSAPLLRLIKKTSQLPTLTRCKVWRIYRKLRRFVQQELLADRLGAVQNYLNQILLAKDGYQAGSLALKLAQCYSEQYFRKLGAARRVERALIQECFFLLRRGFRCHATQKEISVEPSWSTETLLGDKFWQGVCDGSAKASGNSAGLQVYDTCKRLRAEASVSVPSGNAVTAELWACIRVLQTLRALGARHARVLVDSLGVLSGLAGTLPLRYCVQEYELQQLAISFAALEVQLVSRVGTRKADHLASQVSSKSGLAQEVSAFRTRVNAIRD